MQKNLSQRLCMFGLYDTTQMPYYYYYYYYY